MFHHRRYIDITYVYIVMLNNIDATASKDTCSTYTHTQTGFGVTVFVNMFPDCLRHDVYVIMLLQVEFGRIVTDKSDVNLVGADLNSLYDIYDELFHDERVEF